MGEDEVYPFLPLARKLEGSPVWEMGPLTVQVWIWLLLKAVWKPEGYTLRNGIHLERGQAWTTYGLLRKALKARKGIGYTYPSETTLKRIMGRLKADRMVDLKADQLGLVITICKYEEYNTPNFESGPHGGPVSDIQKYKELEEQGVQEQSTSPPTRPPSELDSSDSEPSWKEKIKRLPPQCEQIVRERWLPHAELRKSTTQSAQAQFKMLDQVRLLHAEDGYTWEEIGDIVEYAAKVWHPEGYCASPRSLREWTDKGDQKRHEAILDQIKRQSAQGQAEDPGVASIKRRMQRSRQ